MIIEISDVGGVGRRSRVHAALADPARLRIVDHLVLGDASPGELAAELGLTSNLMTHHLHVLERAGLVARHRSEADGRRSYLRLVPEALAGLQSTTVAAVSRVVFVCTANSARSQLAAALWSRASAVPATSGGTHPAPRIAPGAASTAGRHGLRLATTRPQQIQCVIEPDDFVVTVCDHAHEELGRRGAPFQPTARLHWSVADPVRVGTESAFDAALVDLQDRITRLASRLAAS